MYLVSFYIITIIKSLVDLYKYDSNYYDKLGHNLILRVKMKSIVYHRYIQYKGYNIILYLQNCFFFLKKEND